MAEIYDQIKDAEKKQGTGVISDDERDHIPEVNSSSSDGSDSDPSCDELDVIYVS